jgi:hypothetical protein
MLDLSQMNSGKFRKNISNFNIKDAIAEIVNIQMQKAEYCGIQLTFQMKKFVSESHSVCTD